MTDPLALLMEPTPASILAELNHSAQVSALWKIIDDKGPELASMLTKLDAMLLGHTPLYILLAGHLMIDSVRRASIAKVPDIRQIDSLVAEIAQQFGDIVAQGLRNGK